VVEIILKPGNLLGNESFKIETVRKKQLKASATFFDPLTSSLLIITEGICLIKCIFLQVKVF
jgi:hypothetical protein